MMLSVVWMYRVEVVVVYGASYALGVQQLLGPRVGLLPMSVGG